MGMKEDVQAEVKTLENEEGLWVSAQDWHAERMKRQSAEMELFRLRNSEIQRIAADLVVHRPMEIEAAFEVAESIVKQGSAKGFDLSVLRAEADTLRRKIAEQKQGEAQIDASLREKLTVMSNELKALRREHSSLQRRYDREVPHGNVD